MKKALWKKAGEALTGLYGNVPPMEAAKEMISTYFQGNKVIILTRKEPEAFGKIVA